jgi:hypothetical protein
MKRFLDGMLVTSDVPPIRSMIWPVDDLNAYTWSQEIFSKDWGLKSRDEVKAFLARPVEHMGRTDAWLLDKVGNLAQSVEIWKALLRKDPDDLEAAIRVAPLVDVFEGPEAALAAISKTSGRTAHMFDKRGGGVSPGKPERALTACSAAAEVDEHLDAERLAEALLASGRKKEGLAQAQRIAKAPGKMRNAHALFVLWPPRPHQRPRRPCLLLKAVLVLREPQHEQGVRVLHFAGNFRCALRLRESLLLPARGEQRLREELVVEMLVHLGGDGTRRERPLGLAHQEEELAAQPLDDAGALRDATFVEHARRSPRRLRDR